MRLMVLSANSAGAVYSGGFRRVPPGGMPTALPIGAATGELLVFDATLWADPGNIAGYLQEQADGGRGRRNMPNGLIVNGARFVAGLRLVVEEAGTVLPVTITHLVSNRRVTQYCAETADGIHLSGELFTWGAPESHDSAALYLTIMVENSGAETRSLRVGVVQPTPDFTDLYALRGYLQDSGPASRVRAVSGGSMVLARSIPRCRHRTIPGCGSSASVLMMRLTAAIRMRRGA